MNQPRSMYFKPSSIKMIGALQPNTICHSSQPSGTMPKTLCKIGVYTKMKCKAMDSVIAYTNIMFFHSGSVSSDSEDDSAFMAFSISMTTKIESETVEAVLAELSTNIEQPI